MKQAKSFSFYTVSIWNVCKYIEYYLLMKYAQDETA